MDKLKHFSWRQLHLDIQKEMHNESESIINRVAKKHRRKVEPTAHSFPHLLNKVHKVEQLDDKILRK